MAQDYYRNRAEILHQLVVERSKQGFIYPWECTIMANFVEEREKDAAPFSAFIIGCFLQLLTQVQRSEELLTAIGCLGRSLCNSFHKEVTARRLEIVEAALLAVYRVKGWSDNYDDE